MPLSIRDASACRYDIVALGECMVRLSPPGHGRIEFARSLEVDVGGGEYNAAYAATRLGLRGGFISKLPDNPIARIILNHARAVGMDVSHVRLEPFDGVGRLNRVGLNFTEVGIGVRPSITLYDRGHSSASQMRPDEVDWPSLFEREGCRWLHTGGVFAALSDSTTATLKAALRAARDAGVVTSFDLNYRSSLWSGKKALATTAEILPLIQVFIGNVEALEGVLAFGAVTDQLPAPSTTGRTAAVTDASKLLPDRNLSGTAEHCAKLATALLGTFPNLQAVAASLREVRSGLVNDWTAVLAYEGAVVQAREFKNLEIEDRVGAGDGFAAGVAYGFLQGMKPQETVNFATALGALLHTTRGDTSQVSLDEVRFVMEGGRPSIQR